MERSFLLEPSGPSITTRNLVGFFYLREILEKNRSIQANKSKYRLLDEFASRHLNVARLRVLRDFLAKLVKLSILEIFILNRNFPALGLLVSADHGVVSGLGRLRHRHLPLQLRRARGRLVGGLGARIIFVCFRLLSLGLGQGGLEVRPAGDAKLPSPD